MTDETHSHYGTAGFFRRIFAMCYDLFLLTASLFITSAMFTMINGGEAITAGDVLYIPQMITLGCVSYAFYVWFWTHGGQTLGLKTWRCRVIRDDGNDVDTKRATTRFFASLLSIACCGLGHLWVLVDREGRSWHDMLSGTRIIDLRYKTVSADPTQE